MSVTLRFLDTPIARPAWPEPRSAALADGLLEAFVPVDGTIPRRADLATPGTLCVTTGQQPGLFTGAAYTIHKALSARALAALLQARWGRPVVPVFWLAGDDHDHAEATHGAWVTGAGELREVRLPPRPPGAPLTPMYREPLPPEIAAALDQLNADLKGAEFREGAVAWLARHYRVGATVGGAFAGALAELLAPLGIPCFDPTHPAARRAMAPLLLRAAEQGLAIDRALAARHRELVGAGHDPGVTVGDGATLVMLKGRVGRDRLVTTTGGFRSRRGGEELAAQALAGLAASAPERLSPNVLLRPVVEAALLPTVAYVAGPGELRYLALTPPVYEALAVTPQRPVPRWSGLVLEPFVDRTLPRLGLALEELLADGAGVEGRIARAKFPPQVVEALDALRRGAGAAYATLAALAPEVDPTLVRTMQGLRDRALYQADTAEQKLVRAFKRREGDELRQLRRLRATLRPRGEPQERVLTVAPWLARSGPGFMGALAGAVERWYQGALEAPPVGR